MSAKMASAGVSFGVMASLRTSIKPHGTHPSHTPHRSRRHKPAGHSPVKRPFRGPDGEPTYTAIHELGATLERLLPRQRPAGSCSGTLDRGARAEHVDCPMSRRGPAFNVRYMESSVPVAAGGVATLVFAMSALPMFGKAARRKDPASSSGGTSC